MRGLICVTLFVIVSSTSFAAELPSLKLLFLGDNAGHSPPSRFRLLQPVLSQRNIHLTYTDQLGDLTLKNLHKYDGLIIYANHAKGTKAQVEAILQYVASGKGFIPLHCASYCFIDDAAYVQLVGAQFRSHTDGVFRVKQTKPDHPILQGFQSFESWDETYTHTKHNEKDRTVLEVRTDGDVAEPWTWTRTHGKGRVFYTAWGHDHRTWSHPGFHNLVERGIRWACGQEPTLAGPYVDAPKMKPLIGNPNDFEQTPAKIPFYPPSKTWGQQAAPITTMQKPLSPQKSMTHYTMPKGFELRLFASEEQLGGGKPIAMTWDERGRLWVALTFDYPNELKPEGQGRDKIVVLEDTNRDGVADAVTTFADKLSIPTSLLCVHGGVLVHQAPQTLFLKDTNGDGRADLRQVLFSGWDTSDTHAGPSNLRYGLDNWIYGAVGYAGFRGTIAGERFNFRQGYYRFKLQPTDNGVSVTKLEFLRSTNNNTWGLALSETGELFGSTANGCVLVHAPITNRYYEKVRGLSAGVLQPIALDNRYHPITDKVRQVDWHGGFTSAAGCVIYTARAYPPEYWNRTAFVSDPTGHLTATFVLHPNGTDYVARYGWNLVASRDEWAAPIDAQVGPDGMIWVIDWYNFIVQHNPTPQGFRTGRGNAYETDLRDKQRGRIYRVVYTGAKPDDQPNLNDVRPEQLVEALKHSNMFWRLHAQRLLVETSAARVRNSLQDLVKNHAANPLAALHALQILGTVEVAADLTNASPEVQIAALQNDKTGQLAAKLINSPNVKVRLAALLALSDVTPSRAEVGVALAQALSNPIFRTDRNTHQALSIACQSHPAELLKAVAQVAIPKESLPLIEQVAASFGGTNPDQLESLFTSLTSLSEAATRDAILSGLARGWPTSRKAQLTDSGLSVFTKLLTNATPSTRGKLLKLASSWGVAGLDAQFAEWSNGLLASLKKSDESEAARLDAARQLIELRPNDDSAAEAIIATMASSTSPDFVNHLLDTLTSSRSEKVGPGVLRVLSKLPTSSRPVALRLVLARPASTLAFLDAVEAGTVRFDVLALDQRIALASHPDAKISERAKKLLAQGGGLPDPNRQKVIDSLHDVLTKTGDVANGKKMFIQHCAKCHKHGGEGQQIGPDLTGFAVHPKEEILIHVMDPSRSVEGNYKTYTAKLIDGRVITGLLAAESRTTVELLDAENKRFPINRDDLEEFKESPKSLMPEGFEKQMTPAEITDLLEFLTQKGRYVPLPLDKYATIVTTKGMFYDEASSVERLIFRDWKPKTFNNVPFVLTDPQGDKLKNAIMLYGPTGLKAPTMPKQISLPINSRVAALHLLSGVGGWSYPASPRGTTSMIVRFHYADGSKDDTELKNGIHFADYIRKVEVSGSQHAFNLDGRQIRYLSVKPKKPDMVKQVELVKGPDPTAPVVMAITIETP